MEAKSKSTKSMVRLYGTSNSHEAWLLRDFLQRSTVNFEWIELFNDEDCHKHLGISQINNVRLPVVKLPGGDRLFDPTLQDVANRLGWVNRPKLREYDLAIYGAGPAGLSAAVYAASEGLRTVLIERHSVGGQAGSSSMIENYLGFPKGISGRDLGEKARQQAVKFGAELLMMQEGVKSGFDNDRVRVSMGDGSCMVAKATIFATGVQWRKLNLDNEQEYLGGGLCYGAGASEVQICKDKVVAVIGGGNSAGQAVMHLAEYASKVTMIVRGKNLADSLSQYLVDRILAKPNVEIRYLSEVTELSGSKGCLSKIAIRNKETQQSEWLDLKCLFVCIGGVPNNDWALNTSISMDAAGYIKAGNDVLDEEGLPANWRAEHRMPMYLETSCAGTFVAGDIRHNSIKRVASAVGEGAMAVSLVHKYLSEVR